MCEEICGSYLRSAWWDGLLLVLALGLEPGSQILHTRVDLLALLNINTISISAEPAVH